MPTCFYIACWTVFSVCYGIIYSLVLNLSQQGQVLAAVLYSTVQRNLTVSHCIGVLPLCTITFDNLGIRILFQQIDADALQRVNAPLGVTSIAKVVREKAAEVRGECAVHDGVACLAHDPRLEGEIVQRDG